jgi:hypothetical protein
MSTTGSIQQRRRQILDELGQLEQIRRGSVTDQFVSVPTRDGRGRRRGPYPLYTYKMGGQTVSRRLSGAEQVCRYREQVRAGHRFQELTRELMELGEALCDQMFQADAVKKTPKS